MNYHLPGDFIPIFIVHQKLGSSITELDNFITETQFPISLVHAKVGNNIHIVDAACRLVNIKIGECWTKYVSCNATNSICPLEYLWPCNEYTNI